MARLLTGRLRLYFSRRCQEGGFGLWSIVVKVNELNRLVTSTIGLYTLGIRSAVRVESQHLPNNGAQRSHHQHRVNWVYEVVTQQRAEPGNKIRLEDHQKTQQAKHSVLPDTSYGKPKEEGRQHSCECACSHRKQPANEQKENREAGSHRLILALSNEDLVPSKRAVESFVGVASRLHSRRGF